MCLSLQAGGGGEQSLKTERRGPDAPPSLSLRPAALGSHLTWLPLVPPITKGTRRATRVAGAVVGLGDRCAQCAWAACGRARAPCAGQLSAGLGLEARGASPSVGTGTSVLTGASTASPRRGAALWAAGPLPGFAAALACRGLRSAVGHRAPGPPAARALCGPKPRRQRPPLLILSAQRRLQFRKSC